MYKKQFCAHSLNFVWQCHNEGPTRRATGAKHENSINFKVLMPLRPQPFVRSRYRKRTNFGDFINIAGSLYCFPIFELKLYGDGSHDCSWIEYLIYVFKPDFQRCIFNYLVLTHIIKECWNVCYYNKTCLSES